MPDEKRVNLRFRPEMYERLKTVADKHDTAVAVFAKNVICDAVVKYENHILQMKMTARGQMLAMENMMEKFNENPENYTGLVEMLKPILSEEQQDWVDKTNDKPK